MQKLRPTGTRNVDPDADSSRRKALQNGYAEAPTRFELVYEALQASA